MFITTANTLNIPPSLMDRMEIIRIAGYTEDEKVEIARKHLIPNVTTKHGLDAKEWAIDDEALLTIIRRYTREAGVRNLERELSTLVRKAVKELITSEKKSVKASANNLAKYLGVPKCRYGEVEGKDLIGVVIGLAWTDVGGELLTIEAAMMPGKGRMMVTGNLRDVMKESISAAAAYVRSRAVAFGIEPPLFDKRDIHDEWQVHGGGFYHMMKYLVAGEAQCSLGHRCPAWILRAINKPKEVAVIEVTKSMNLVDR
jgi:ATP-dependent Lon protease